ncbi:hypothetical protein TWF694_009767 [Orbilia ellipsospora]|uniref:Zn(2)-C6 fungal-type domain-containing protein n=1 Tax=Orbilia ellipsospora TaxID=2528407 RepID=A0AAV9XD82_9PEZI
MNRHSYPGAGYTSTPTASYSQRPSLGAPFMRPSRPQPRVDEVAYSQIGASGSTQNNTARKRVNVACGRCRKRKIRCSGDPGAGGSCQNCKNAGVAAGLCQFLRVQCRELQLNDPQPSSSDLQTALYHESRYDPAACISSTLSTTYPSAACISAPPIMNTNHFEAQLAGVLVSTPSHIHGLQASRSLPTINRRSQTFTANSQESDHLSLLATSAAHVASLPGASGEYSNLDLASTDVETLPTCAPSTYGLSSSSHWDNHAVDEVLRTVAEIPHLRPTASDRDKAKSYVPPSEQSPLFFDGAYVPPVSTASPAVSTYLQTSNVRDGFSDSFSYSTLTNGLSHMGIKVAKGQPIPPSSSPSLQTHFEKGDIDAQSQIVYAGGVPANYHVLPYNFYRVPPTPVAVEPYNSLRQSGVSSRKFSDPSAPSPAILTSFGEEKDTRTVAVSIKNRIPSTSPLSSSPSPTSSMGNHGKKASLKQAQALSTSPQNTVRDSLGRDCTQRMSNNFLAFERATEYHPGHIIPTSRTTAQSTRAVPVAPRPSSAGCGSAAASPKFAMDQLQYTYSHSQHRHPTVGH